MACSSSVFAAAAFALPTYLARGLGQDDYKPRPAEIPGRGRVSSASPIPDELAAESKFQMLTRLGFLARGLLYIVIGLLVIGTGRTEDLTGALDYLDEGVGQLLLIVLVAGLATYGLWRLADAAFAIEHPLDDGSALTKRAAAGLIGAIYLYLAYKATRILLDAGGASTSAQQQADTVLDLPGGQLVLGLAALVLAVAGAYQLHTAVTCGFLRRLDARAQAPLVKWLGRIGYAARGVIFLTVAALIGQAALDDQSTEAGGMEQALDLLSGPLLFVVAGGLILFGAFSMVEARYRRIHDAPDGIKREVKDRVGI